jgi:hypothetical protein
VTAGGINGIVDAMRFVLLFLVFWATKVRPFRTKDQKLGNPSQLFKIRESSPAKFQEASQIFSNGAVFAF